MQEHLLIDGNNALHAIPEIGRELKHDRNLARDSLLRLLEPLATNGNSLVTVVFDGRDSPQSLRKHREINEFTIIYSSSVEGADGAIEKMLMAAKYPDRIVVVTNDGLIRNCAYAHGASTMRVEEMVKRLDYEIESFQASRARKKPFKGGDSFENKIPFPK